MCARTLASAAAAAAAVVVVLAAAAVCKCFFNRDFTLFLFVFFLRNRLLPAFNDDVDVETRCIS